MVLTGLGFAATELRLALHPQLEQYGVSEPGASSYPSMNEGLLAEVSFTEPPPPPAAPAPQSQKADGVRHRAQNQSLDQIAVTGTRIKSADLFSYPADAIVQSGAARPNWNWQRHDISWNGPLLPDDEFGLLVSPPPLTRLWRIAAVLLLVALLWRVIRAGALLPRIAPRAHQRSC